MPKGQRRLRPFHLEEGFLPPFLPSMALLRYLPIPSKFNLLKRRPAIPIISSLLSEVGTGKERLAFGRTFHYSAQCSLICQFVIFFLQFVRRQRALTGNLVRVRSPCSPRGLLSFALVGWAGSVSSPFFSAAAINLFPNWSTE